MKAGKSMQELSEGDELRRYLDPRLIKALGHPVREHILAVLNERIASATEIGEELGADVSSFYHHIEELERLECIERVETRRRRGANEHFFRARKTLLFDDAAWRELPDSLKADSMTNVLQLVIDDVVASVGAETFAARDETHVSWSPGRFDDQGWREATELLKKSLQRLTAIQDASAKRLAGQSEGGLSASVAILAFETPEAAGEVVPIERAQQLGKTRSRASAP